MQNDPACDQKGRETEIRVGKVLLSFYKQRIIKGFEQTEQFSDEDKMGIDFFVIGHNNRRMPLQVKSSRYGQNEFQMRKPAVPCIIGTVGNVELKLIQLLKKAGLVDQDERFL